jgi:signal transduction histidine kinase
MEADGISREGRSLHVDLEHWSFLAQVSQHLAEAGDYEQTLRSIAELAVPRLGDWSIVDLSGQDGSMRRLGVVHPDPEMQFVARQLETGWPPHRDDPLGIPAVMRTRSVETVVNVSDDFLKSVARDEEHLGLLRLLGVTSVLSVPLIAREEVLGAITFVRTTDSARFSPDDLNLAEGLAARCALAIHHSRRVEELKQSVLLRDQVLGYVAHDLKNPLSAIMLLASTLLQNEKAGTLATRDGRVSQIEDILEATVQMQRLIGDLLEVAQIGAGGITLERRRIEPSILVEDVRRIYAQGLAAHSLRLETSVSEELPALFADPHRLRQVFENLLENAAKFTRAGGTVTICAGRISDSVVFSVADTGAGISAAEMPHLFEQFWQGRLPGRGSAGLGLTICKGIVESHGGAIWAESKRGEGSTFYFRIPVGE